MVVGGQVVIILVGVIGARDIARVVKAEPCGLLHKRDRGDLSGEEGVGTWGWTLGAPDLTLFPTVSRPSGATSVGCALCGGRNCQRLMLLGSGLILTCGGQSHQEAARTEGAAHAAPTCPWVWAGKGAPVLPLQAG